MSISEHFRYRNDVFQSDIFVSDIGLTDDDVGCRISPTLISLSMPTYEHDVLSLAGITLPAIVLLQTTVCLIWHVLGVRAVKIPAYCYLIKDVLSVADSWQDSVHTP
jgi:hypothetical protein